VLGDVQRRAHRADDAPVAVTERDQGEVEERLGFVPVGGDDRESHPFRSDGLTGEHAVLQLDDPLRFGAGEDIGDGKADRVEPAEELHRPPG
jgi:hypothetical protein